MEIIKIIEDYILNDKADGALLINGDWGIGKSFFWRNKIVPAIEKLKSQAADKPYKCLYVSLNGLSDTSQIINQLALSKLPWTKTKGAQIAFSLGSIMLNAAGKIPFISNKTGEQSTELFKNFKIDDFLNFSANVICFDDLERISKSLTTEEVVGFINTNFIETNKVKVIIIANEKEINSQNEYQRIKEKTITRTLNFGSNLITISEIFDRYKENQLFFKFLHKEEEYIRKVITDYKEKNLRTIIFCLDILKNVFNTNTSISDSDQLGKSLVLFSFLISFEFKTGNLKSNDSSDYKGLVDLSEEKHTNSLVERLTRKMAKSSSSSEQQAPYHEQFYNRYNISDDLNFYFFKSVYKYILSGFLNEGLLKEDFASFNEWIAIKEKNKQRPEQISFKNLQRAYWLNSDEEVEKTRDAVIKYAENGKYLFYEYANIYTVFKNLIANGLIDDSISRINDILIKGCKSAISSKTSDISDLEFVETQFAENGTSELNILIRTEIKRLENDKHINKIDGFFNALKEEWDYFSKYGYPHFDLFRHFTGQQIFERIKDFEISAYRNLAAYFEGILKVTNLHEFYSKNSQEMQILMDLIKEKGTNEPSKLKKYLLRIIREEIQKLASRLEV